MSYASAELSRLLHPTPRGVKHTIGGLFEGQSGRVAEQIS